MNICCYWILWSHLRRKKCLPRGVGNWNIVRRFDRDLGVLCTHWRCQCSHMTVLSSFIQFSRCVSSMGSSTNPNPIESPPPPYRRRARRRRIASLLWYTGYPQGRLYAQGQSVQETYTHGPVSPLGFQSPSGRQGVCRKKPYWEETIVFSWINLIETGNKASQIGTERERLQTMGPHNPRQCWNADSTPSPPTTIWCPLNLSLCTLHSWGVGETAKGIQVPWNISIPQTIQYPTYTVG